MKKEIIFYFPPINKLGNPAFRKICLLNGADYVFTEMIRLDKLIENDIVQINKLKVFDMGSKTFVQIISTDINLIEKGIDKILEYFPSVKEINYNMGCPQSTLCKKECGGGIVGNPLLVEKVSKILKNKCDLHSIRASIKIRLGLNREKITIYENIKRISDTGINKIYIHGRALNDTYSKSATYNEIEKIKKDFPKLNIIGNGDVIDCNSYNNIIKTNCDGVMIGRKALQNPEIFKYLKKCSQYSSNNRKNYNDISENLSGINLKNKFKILNDYIIYAKKYEISISQVKSNIAYMTSGVINGSKFRFELNKLNSINEIHNLIKKINI